MIDWAIAERIAMLVAGDPPQPRLSGDLPEIATVSERLVSGYTGLDPPEPLPPPEAVGRPQWVRANVRSMRTLIDPLAERLGGDLGPLTSVVRAGAGYVLAAEVGILLGYMAQRVLGQYELVLLEPDTPGRLLFVAPNLEQMVEKLDADRDELVRWVALHEVTHSLQFAGVPWLREHMAGLIRELLEGVNVEIDPARMLRLPGPEDLRKLVDALRGGDLISIVTTPEQRVIVDRIQAVMAVLEGYAEHAMDVVGAEVLPTLPHLRAALERRRASRSAAARVLERLFGLDLKMRQYEVGKRFCDAVAQEGGIETLNRVWRGPDALPTLSELDDPGGWAERTRVPSVTK